MIRSGISFAAWLRNIDSTAPLAREMVSFKSGSKFGNAKSDPAAPPGRIIYLSSPGVETPGSVLISLRDSPQVLTGRGASRHFMIRPAAVFS